MSFVVENNVIKTEDIDFDFTELGGLGNVIFNAMKKFSQNVAQIDPETDRKYTYEYVLRHSIRTAMVMKQIGVKKGDIVMGCSDNHMDACVPIIAALFLGAIPCSIDPNVTILEMTHILTLTKPKIIFTVPSAVKNVEDVCRDLKLDTKIVVFGSSDGHLDFKSFIEQQTGEDDFKPVISHDPFETAVIYFSSGTSGLAKACCLSHAHFIMQANQVPTNTPVEHLDFDRRNFEWSQFKKGGGFLCYSPLYWITGGKILVSTVCIGATRVLCKKFDPQRFWEIVEKYRILLCLLLPYHITQLVKFGKPANVNTESLIKIITGGAALQVTHWRIVQDMLPDADIVQSYGLTETGVILNFEVYNKEHRAYYKQFPKSLGMPMKGIWYKVVDPDTNEPLGPNQEGELLVKSKLFMNGYYNEPKDQIFDSDGWYRTGDVVYYTDDGVFYLTDRLKELLKYRQLTVYPYVIEDVLYKHPAVAQVAALGVPHEDDGERPAAFVVLHPDYDTMTAEELRKFADERLQDRAQLRGGLRIVKSLPRTSTGKVKRRELRRWIMEEK